MGLVDQNDLDSDSERACFRVVSFIIHKSTIDSTDKECEFATKKCLNVEKLLINKDF